MSSILGNRIPFWPMTLPAMHLWVLPWTHTCIDCSYAVITHTITHSMAHTAIFGSFLQLWLIPLLIVWIILLFWSLSAAITHTITHSMNHATIYASFCMFCCYFCCFWSHTMVRWSIRLNFMTTLPGSMTGTCRKPLAHQLIEPYASHSAIWPFSFSLFAVLLRKLPLLGPETYIRPPFPPSWWIFSFPSFLKNSQFTLSYLPSYFPTFQFYYLLSLPFVCTTNIPLIPVNPFPSFHSASYGMFWRVRPIGNITRLPIGALTSGWYHGIHKGQCHSRRGSLPTLTTTENK